MTSLDDEKALRVLEEAVNKAQDTLEKTKYFQPFLMLLNDSGDIEVFENGIDDASESYAKLEEVAKDSVQMGGVDIMVLAVDTFIPENFVKDIPQAIRLHLEEKSQRDKKLSARFLYVPYELCQVKDGEMYVRLHTPITVGFPAEYIVNK